MSDALPASGPLSLVALLRLPSGVSSCVGTSQPDHQGVTVEAAEKAGVDASKFAIGFDHRDRARLFELWTEVLDSERWSEGPMLAAFERRWSQWNGLTSLGLSSWAGGALAALEFAGVRGETVLCPSNTFMATPLAAIEAGAGVEFVDCNRDDLCMSFEDFEAKAERSKPKAAILVHIGGHIAFDSERIAAYCRESGIFLLEDCAHAHGAGWGGRRPGSFGDAGVYSLYATKTISTGEGGILVSSNPELIEFAARFRNYGKLEHKGLSENPRARLAAADRRGAASSVGQIALLFGLPASLLRLVRRSPAAHAGSRIDPKVDGLNFRMSEFTAALGLVQADRMEEIVAWKNAYAREHLDPLHPARPELPDGMTSGLYKYVVFEPIEKSTGRVYEEPCHRIMGRDDDLPNTDWVAQNHWCVPLYYRPESREDALAEEEA